MRPLPRLAAIATAVPPHRLDQSNVVARVEQLFGRSPDFERLISVYANSGIACRYSAVPFEWFDEPHGWAERNRAYIAGALDLIEAAAVRALNIAGIGLDEVGGIVAVSTTGVATPSLDALLIERLHLPPDVQRLPIFGLGCAGGALGLARAATLAAAMPDRAVLLLVVELCTLQFRRDDLARSNIVATALFGDGAAAAVLRCDERAGDPAVVAAGEHTWPHSLDIMGWDVAEDGLKAIFSRDIPRLVAAELGPVLGDFLARARVGVGRYQPLRLPSRRTESHRCLREPVRRRFSRCGRSASLAVRLRQHVGRLSALRSRAPARVDAGRGREMGTRAADCAWPRLQRRVCRAG